MSTITGLPAHILLNHFVVVLGPSGSGKTSLLFCLGGLLSPTAGEVRWDGRRLSNLELQARIGARGGAFAYLFQGSNLMPTFTAAENVALLLTGFVSATDNVTASENIKAELALTAPVFCARAI